MKCIFGFDIGGTNIKIGKFVLEEGEFKLALDYYIKTIISDDYHDLLIQIIDEIDNNLNDDELYGIGVGVPGPVVDGVVLGAENIHFGEVDIKGFLKEKYPDAIIKVLNDANTATLGEWYYGDGNKASSMILVTLGTGIGGGIIVNGKLLKGATGSAGEIGHIKIFPFNGRECTCGLSGCVEQYASGTGIVRTALGMMNNGNTVIKNKKRIHAKDVFDGAYQGDKICLDVIDKTGYYLAIALADIADLINPEKIVIGGGLSRSGEILLESVKKHFASLCFYTVKNTEITLATLYNTAGIMGCLYAVSVDEEE